MKYTSDSNSSDRRCFCFGKAIFAGIIATLFLQIIMFLQGHNSPFELGKMILGPQAMPAYIYLAGGAFCLLVGTIFALFYALVIAPMHFIHDFVQAIIFATIMTVIAIFTFPKLQTIFDKATGRQSQIEAPVPQSIEAEKSTEVAKNETQLTKSEDSEKKASAMQMVLSNFINHLIYAFSVIVIYRHRKKNE